MGTVGSIIIFLIVGLIAGFLARAIVPGRQHMGILATLILGILGSFLGGLLGSLLPGGTAPGIHASGIIGSVIGAIIIVLIWSAVRGRNRAA